MSGNISMFNSDNFFWSKVSYIFDLVILGLLWIFTSIPIITAGAGTTAVYYVVLRMDGKKPVKLIQDYFHSFKQNFKQATILWLIMLCFIALFAFEISGLLRVYKTGNAFAGYLLVLSIVLCIFFMVIGIYIFPYLSRFEGGIYEIIKNAFYLSFRNLGFSILLILIRILVLIGLYYCLNIFPFTEAMIAGLSGIFFRRIFKPYLTEQKKE